MRSTTNQYYSLLINPIEDQAPRPIVHTNHYNMGSVIMLYISIITLLPFFIEMLQYDWLWSGHMIIKEMFYIPIKLKPELARAPWRRQMWTINGVVISNKIHNEKFNYIKF
jgi:hypothetical protein